MFRQNKWYYYKNDTQCGVRYMLRLDIMSNGTEVWAVIGMYDADEVNMFTFPTEEKAQESMKMLTAIEV